ncbi:hypothetical protein QF035_010375 [Streptomyces umbrinus]|uniref:Uncharacterized protein n=1 Tax=Streptomyces umbrinus TaxID=67370 RepID=A0ABU0TAH1_9ACTN|nr:hypothetical protein [Streptomyces umbrinus]MDQ1032793.1 hypothetical protein [Streptomyces umbrinus]
MVDVLTWTIERRMRLTERAELLRKELAEVDAELGRLEAAEVVFGQWAEATDGGRRPSGIVEPERVAAGPGAGGMRLVPDRVEGMGLASICGPCSSTMACSPSATRTSPASSSGSTRSSTGFLMRCGNQCSTSPLGTIYVVFGPKRQPAPRRVARSTPRSRRSPKR